MVMNHTSDQHPWFQESRLSKDSDKADWYVWGDDEHRWSEARIIFVDTERSDWTLDESRQQYYWHRFFSHQPDLNYDNPAVADAMIDVVRFWLGLNPVLPNANFAEIVIVTRDLEARERVKARLEPAIAEGAVTAARARVDRFVFGPPVGFPVQFRVAGPDPMAVRAIAAIVILG